MRHLQPNEKHLADKLQHLPAPDVEQSWEKMRKLLDRDMPEPAAAGWSGNGKWWWMGITAGVIMLAVWLSQEFKQSTTTVAEQTTTTTNNTDNTDNKTDNKSTVNTTEKNTATSNANTTAASTQQTTSSTGSIASIPTGNDEAVSGNTPPTTDNNNVVLGRVKKANSNEQPPGRNYGRKPIISYLDGYDSKDVTRTKNESSSVKDNSTTRNNNSIDNKITDGSTKELAAAEQADEDALLQGHNTARYAKTAADPSNPFSIIENTEPRTKIIAGKTDKAFAREMRKKSMKADDRRMSRASMRGSSGDKEHEITFAAGLALPQSVAVGSQQSSNYNVNAKTTRVTDYLPAPFFQYHINPKLFVQTEFHFQSPQYTERLLLAKKNLSFPNAMQTTSLYLEKLYYFNIPLNVYYSPARNVYIGGGLQYSSLLSGVATYEEKRMEGQNQVGYRSITQRFKDDSIAAAFAPSEWRYQFDANYNFNKFTLGMRYNRSMTDFINTPTIQARNTAFLLYLRYNIWEERRKD